MQGIGIDATSSRNLDGGILVFFPSYGVMESAAARWKQNGMWNALCSAGGHVIMESRGGGNPARSNRGTGGNVQPQTNTSMKWKDSEPENPSPESPDNSHLGVVREFEFALETIGKCILLAVCRYAGTL